MRGRGVACMAGGVHGEGACMVGGHVWQGACVAGGMHGRGGVWQGGMHSRRACMTGDVHGRGVHAWKGVGMFGGGMCGRGVGGMHGEGRRAWQIQRDTVNERAVRILLECIIVSYIVSSV